MVSFGFLWIFLYSKSFILAFFYILKPLFDLKFVPKSPKKENKPGLIFEEIRYIFWKEKKKEIYLMLFDMVLLHSRTFMHPISRNFGKDIEFFRNFLLLNYSRSTFFWTPIFNINSIYEKSIILIPQNDSKLDFDMYEGSAS